VEDNVSQVTYHYPDGAVLHVLYNYDFPTDPNLPWTDESAARVRTDIEAGRTDCFGGFVEAWEFIND
jgi:hypothetical protein